MIRVVRLFDLELSCRLPEQTVCEPGVLFASLPGRGGPPANVSNDLIHSTDEVRAPAPKNTNTRILYLPAVFTMVVWRGSVLFIRFVSMFGVVPSSEAKSQPLSVVYFLVM